MKRSITFFILLIVFTRLAISQTTHTFQSIQPVRGTFINLFYQDVRNKYMNPQSLDNTDPEMWTQKVKEMHDMGIEYLVFMAVANDGKSDYPSKMMPWNYSKEKKSPVDAIMDEAAALDMKVFMSIGWAKNQDDNLRNPATCQRQLAMMRELASIYGNHKAFYGWYLPVEDCLCPIFADHAVNAVNELTKQARSLTPQKKIMISPYGIYESAFGDPNFEKQLAKLNVDIIAYQDEVGCVREPYPIPNLKKHWKMLRDIHNRLHIALWANCESFTWEKGLNDRNSALIPASFSRFLSQLSIASEASVDNIIAFSICGIYDTPHSKYQLGQPDWSQKVYDNYKAWRSGDEYWSMLAASFSGRLSNMANQEHASYKQLIDGELAEENPKDACWIKFNKGHHEVVIDMQKSTDVHQVMMRVLNCHKSNIELPSDISLYLSSDGKNYSFVQKVKYATSLRDASYFPNNKHDAWIEGIYFPHINKIARYIKIAFTSLQSVYTDEVYVNPSIQK